MIGNDIIDLRLACQESNWQRKGYLGKIFTAAEQEMIHQAVTPSDMVWLLWSCKEAAYKIVNRISNIRVYNPIKFDCSLSGQQEQSITGKIYHAAKSYSFISHRSQHCIHTIAVAHEIFFDSLDIYTGHDWPLHLLDKCALMKNQDGIPYMMNCYSHSPLPVSISHHGEYYGVVKNRIQV
ncbi:4'-phosphopantetheinyl transferase family protein [Chitinophaga rhizophila]|uniref:4'-phosphopantetheinyl transferase superfamily protein n=1 Tax=Chitinophaga rhizophila TaxID=2866212 RepID=A0ABS7G520_9BACT|nr:4'-phosphopantetheinyl transferase superfamily protein [Chitinophaga rhizophila]MBW8682748.1 4'-phosphopantetheinyl transferase superfamily protein [Chitinophaga rhizophila]